MTATKKKKKKEETKAVELVPYKCYACSEYDGTFGPEEGSHSHVCATCKELPSEDEGPIQRHCDEYYAKEGEWGEETLPCEACERERDECTCNDNTIRLQQPLQFEAGTFRAEYEPEHTHNPGPDPDPEPAPNPPRYALNDLRIQLNNNIMRPNR